MKMMLSGVVLLVVFIGLGGSVQLRHQLPVFNVKNYGATVSLIRMLIIYLEPVAIFREMERHSIQKRSTLPHLLWLPQKEGNSISQFSNPPQIRLC